MTVFKSSRHFYIQLIDDKQGKTLAHASSLEKEFLEKAVAKGLLDSGIIASTKQDSKKSSNNTKKSSKKSILNSKTAVILGEMIGDRAKKAGVKDNIVFDRGGYLYHGVLKVVADTARSSGLKF